ncbi:MAG: hypothetical protein ACI93N_002509 [Flavobacteriaceae bacterium]|jgi:hypothetical protein
MKESILDFFSHPFFAIIGGVSTLIAVCLFFYGIYGILRGFLPVGIRLGKSLYNRKIAIYAESSFESLKSLMIDSGIFKAKNIIQIQKDSFKKGEEYSMMLVNHSDYSDTEIKSIISYKKDSDSLIIYAKPRSVDIKILDKINENRNAIVVNFRGRLLNDIVTSMITTTYEKK